MTATSQARRRLAPLAALMAALAALVHGELMHRGFSTLPFVLFGVPAPHDVEVLPVLTYIESFQNFRFGLSAAMAVLSLLLIAVPLAVYLRAVRLDVGERGERP